MTDTPAAFDEFLESGSCVAVTIIEAYGSVPRDAGAWMLVSASRIFGTIGGGQLEFRAIAEARAMLNDGRGRTAIDVPLGPAIGQCCGGHVTLELKPVDDEAAEEITARLQRSLASRPAVFVFGAGHVGRALAQSLCLLPVRTTVVETRPEALFGLSAGVETQATALPEATVDEAQPESAFVVLTHEHALDFLITKAALERRDAAYVGMIGSRTKRATFEKQYAREGGDPALLAHLTCPIGGKLGDKRPEVIAALVTAEIVHRLLG